MDDALKEIRKIRANNNDLWMKILDIALRNSPEETKEVLAEIRLNDVMITEYVAGIIEDDNQE